MDNDLQQYKQNPRRSIAERATGFVKDYWVITGLLAAVASVIIFYFVSSNAANITPSYPSVFPTGKYFISF